LGKGKSEKKEEESKRRITSLLFDPLKNDPDVSMNEERRKSLNPTKPHNLNQTRENYIIS
jgi:hypothetical protein